MLEFILIEETGKQLIYRYFPEGKEKSGIVTYDKVKSEFEIVQLAENDEFKSYAYHMINRIRKNVERGIVETEGLVAWY